MEIALLVSGGSVISSKASLLLMAIWSPFQNKIGLGRNRLRGTQGRKAEQLPRKTPKIMHVQDPSSRPDTSFSTS